MTKLYIKSFAVFLSTLSFFLISSAVFSQNIEETHVIEEGNGTGNTFGSHITISPDGKSIITHGDDGTTNFYDYDNNEVQLVHTEQSEYKKRTINVDGENHVFYLLPYNGYIENDGAFPRGDYKTSADDNHKIWVSPQSEGTHYFYIHVYNFNMGSPLSDGFEVVEIDQKLGASDISIFSEGYFGYFPTISVGAEEDDNNVKGQKVIFKSDWELYISDPQYDGYTGRVIKYEIEGGFWKYREAKSLYDAGIDYGNAFGSHFELTRNSSDGVAFFVHGNGEVSITDFNNPTSKGITKNISSYGNLTGTYSSFENVNLSIQFTEILKFENAGKEHLEFFKLDQVDKVDEGIRINSTDYDKIYDVFVYSDKIIVAGLRGSDEVIEEYIPGTFFDSFTLANSIKIGTGSVASSQLHIMEDDESFSVFSRTEQEIRVFDKSDITATATKLSFKDVTSWTGFGSGMGMIYNNVIVGDNYQNNFSIQAIPYVTVDDGNWWESKAWSGGKSPDSQDKNAHVYIDHNLSLNYNESYHSMTVNSIGHLTLLSAGEGSSAELTVPNFKNDGTITIQKFGGLICENIQNTGIITFADDYSTFESKNLVSDGTVTIGSGNNTTLGGKINGVLNTYSDLNIGYNFEVNGLINFGTDDVGIVMSPIDADITFQSNNTYISTYVKVLNKNSNSFKASIKNNLWLKDKLLINSDNFDFKQLSLRIGNNNTDEALIDSRVNIPIEVKALEVSYKTTLLNKDGSDGDEFIIEDNIKLDGDLYLQGINLVVPYRNSNTVFDGDANIYYSSSYDEYVLVEFRNSVTTPFSIDLPFYSEETDDGSTGIYYDASLTLNVTKLNTTSGRVGILFFTNKFDSYDDLIFEQDGEFYGLMPGKSWYIEGGEGVSSIAGSITTAITNTYDWNITEASELVLEKDDSGTKNIITATGDLSNVAFGAFNPDEQSVHNVRVLTTSIGGTFTTVANNAWETYLTWDKDRTPRYPQDNAIVEHTIDMRLPPEDFIINSLVIDNTASENSAEVNLVSTSDGTNYALEPYYFFTQNLNLYSGGVFELDYVNLEVLNDITLDGVIVNTFDKAKVVDTSAPHFSFYGEKISSTDPDNSQIFISNFNVEDGEATRTIQIDVPLTVDEGLFHVYGNNETIITNQLNLINGARFTRGHDFTINNSGSTANDYNFTFHTEESHHFNNLTLIDVNSFTFESNAVIRNSLVASQTQAIYIAGASQLDVLGDELDGSYIPNSTPFKLEVPLFAGADGAYPSDLNIDIEDDQERAYVIGGRVENINSIGDTLYVIDPNWMTYDDTNNSSGAIKFLLNSPEFNANLQADSEYGGTYPFTLLNSEDDSLVITYSIYDPFTYKNRHKDIDEEIVIEYNGGEITNFALKDTLLNDGYEDIKFNLIKVPLTAITDLDNSTHFNIEIDVRMRHKKYTDVTTNWSTIIFEYVPEGYLDTNDIDAVADLFTSLTFRDGDFASNFGVSWTPTDLYTWDGEMAAMPGLENYIDFDEYGFLTYIDISNKNVESWSISHFAGVIEGGEGGFLEETGGFKGEVQVNEGELEIPIGGPVIGYYSHVTINADGNYLYFDQFDDYYEGTSPTIQYTPASPFEVYNETYTLGDDDKFSLNDNYLFGDTYEWLKKNEDSGVFEAITNTDENLGITALADNGTYQAKLYPPNEWVFDFHLTIEININVERGQKDRDNMITLLAELGLGSDYNPVDPIWEWNDSIRVDDYGYVRKVSLDEMDLTEAPASLSNFAYIDTLSLEKNTISSLNNIPSLSVTEELNINDNQFYFDDIDDVNNNVNFTFGAGIDFVIGNQNYASVEEIEATVKGGESYSATITPAPTYSNLVYTWEQDNSFFKNDIEFDIPIMDKVDEGNYMLYVSSSDIPDLNIKIADIDITFALGDQDSSYVHDLLTELGITFEETDPFRNWNDNGIITNIDDHGLVTSIDLSGSSLDHVPDALSSFASLDELYINDNNIYFDELDELLSLPTSVLDYGEQNVTPTVINAVVKHGDNYTSSITQEYSDISYDWKKGITSVFSTKDISFSDFQPGDAGTYDLSVTSMSHNAITYDLYQINLTYTLGDYDSAYIRQFIVDLGKTIDNPSDGFRDWTVDGVSYTVDAYGAVTTLNISGNDLTSIPRSLDNLGNLETLDVTNNQLYFDELDYLSSIELVNFYYGNQTIDPVQQVDTIVKGGEGYTSALSAAPTYSDLTYEWVFDNAGYSNVLDLDISNMTREDEGNYQLFISSSNHDGLEIKFADINITFALGDQDSTKVHDLLTELGITFNEDDPFRTWNSEG
ncbi:hypothetical protein, partial [Flammeovirga agarivorans]